MPEPTVSLVLNPATAAVGQPVSAVWTVSNAVSCTGYGPALPSGGLALNPNGGYGQLVSAANSSHAGVYSVLCAASDGDQASANANLNVVTPSIILNGPGTVTLNDDYSLSANINPITASATNYTFMIKKSSSSSWYTLGSQSSLLLNTYAMSAGNFNIQVVAEIYGQSYTSSQESISVNFPDFSQITSNSVVQNAIQNSWSSIKSYASPSARREEGFWIKLNTQSRQYEVTNVVYGPDAASGPPPQGAAVNMGSRPGDSVSSPAPTQTVTYTVGLYHGHPPMTYIDPNWCRDVGPSPGDNSNHAGYDIAGIVYDYNAITNGQICGGHNINSSAAYYSSGPSSRSTP